MARTSPTPPEGTLASVNAPTRTARPDAACVSAIDVARAAAVELVGESVVGDHLGVEADGERLVTHLFDSQLPGYRGWRWAVTVTRVSRGRVITVDEVVHLPGSQALLAPPWVPWAERLQPGDVGVGDLLPAAEEDPRLEPGWSSVGDEVDPEVEFVARDLGLARRRVLSAEGREEAADRWLNSAGGPFVPLAEQAPATCDSCGFFVRIGRSRAGLRSVCQRLLTQRWACRLTGSRVRRSFGGFVGQSALSTAHFSTRASSRRLGVRRPRPQLNRHGRGAGLALALTGCRATGLAVPRASDERNRQSHQA